MVDVYENDRYVCICGVDVASEDLGILVSTYTWEYAPGFDGRFLVDRWWWHEKCYKKTLKNSKKKILKKIKKNSKKEN